VGSFQHLLDIPAIPRVLRLIKEERTGSREDTLIENLPDRAYAQKAIETLIDRGIITRQDRVLKIAEDEETSRRVTTIMRFYADVERMTRRRLLFRGILNATRYSCLVHIDTLVGLMEAEGFSRQDVDAVLANDGKEGYVERLKILYRSREGLKHRSFPFIPLYYYPHFIMMKPQNTGHLRERLSGAGIAMVEEEYLLGHYPKEIAVQSRDYMTGEKEHVTEKIRNEAFDIWWYYRF
jgi:hypothetical protein